MTNTTTTSTLDERIAARDAELSPAEQRVATFLAEHREEAAFLSAAEMAGRLGTSDATVVRAVQSLGYSGLLDLKRELSEALRSRVTPAVRLGRSLEEIRGAEPAAALEYVLTEQIALLEETGRTVRPEAFARAAHVLTSAERTLVFGIGPMGILAEYLALRLTRFGREARPVVSTGLLLADSLLAVRASDVFVVFSYSRVLRETSVVLDRAKRLGITVILLTDTLAAALADRVDVALSAPRGGSGMWSTVTTTMVLLDALLLAVATHDRARSLAALDELEALRTQLTDDRGSVTCA